MATSSRMTGVTIFRTRPKASVSSRQHFEVVASETPCAGPGKSRERAGGLLQPVAELPQRGRRAVEGSADLGKRLQRQVSSEIPQRGEIVGRGKIVDEGQRRRHAPRQWLVGRIPEQGIQ